jgi:hypothetical protein
MSITAAIEANEGAIGSEPSVARVSFRVEGESGPSRRRLAITA